MGPIGDALDNLADFFGGSPPHKGPLYEAMIHGGPSFVEEYTGNMGRAMSAGNTSTSTTINFSPSFTNTVQGGSSGLMEDMERQSEYTMGKMMGILNGGVV